MAKKRRLPTSPGYDPNIDETGYTPAPKQDPINKLTRSDALERLKRIRDIIWPFIESADERQLHHISSHQALQEVKEVFERPLRMLPTWKFDACKKGEDD